MTAADIQTALLARGYDVGPSGADGDAGPHTIAALNAFQLAAGLVPDGIAGPLTIAALGQPEATTRLRAEARIPAWLALAQAEVGIVEDIGKGSNPKVVAYFRDAGFAGVKDDAVAWCAAFVGAMLKRSGIAPSGSLAARSYENWGFGLKEPVLGCIATKKRENGAAWQGHVGFVVAASASSIVLLGGNQGDSVSVKSFRRVAFTAFRWPKEVTLPTGSVLPRSVRGAGSGGSEA